jgi:hypothetical protein
MFQLLQEVLSAALRVILFYYSEGKLLCSFWDTKSKPVLLLDSFEKVGVHEKGKKPDTVLHYNKTKSGVDNMINLLECAL